MTAPTPIAWSTIEDAIATWIETATGLASFWAGQSAPQPAYPYVSLKRISGPTRIHGRDEWRYSTDLTLALDISITPVAADAETYTATINGTAFSYVSGIGATVAEITAALTSLINAGAEPVTAADETTKIGLTGDAGVKFQITVTSNMSWANDDVGHEVANTVCGLREMTVSVQAFVGKPESGVPTTDAVQHLSVANSALGSPTVLALLDAAGLAIIDEGDVTDISEIVGDAFDSRAQFDVRFLLAANAAEHTGYIDHVLISSADMGLVDKSVGGS